MLLRKNQNFYLNLSGLMLELCERGQKWFLAMSIKPLGEEWYNAYYVQNLSGPLSLW